jgi:hypothetical protein
MDNNSVYAFAVSGTEIIAGTYGGVFISTNSGANWLPVNYGLTGYFVYSLAINGSDIFAGTIGTGVWKRPISELTGISKEASVLPKDYILFQNYPNPFNPNTIISYSLPSASNVKLILYNTIGQTIKVIENGFKNAGNHSINFNAAGLSSGIYFYKLEAGQFTQVKKMILIK